MSAKRAGPIGAVVAVVAIALATLLGGVAEGLYAAAGVVALLTLGSWWFRPRRAWSWRMHGGGLLVSVLLLAGGMVVGGAGDDADRYRCFVATPDRATLARVAPFAGAAVGGAPYSTSDPVWVVCLVEGPGDDRYWYRLEDGTFLPEDVVFPERRGDAGTPPRC